ncbi:pyridoxal phosphate-dependent decarboxylase family protein [Micromonosporaceae bacterium Da 78-11]
MYEKLAADLDDLPEVLAETSRFAVEALSHLADRQVAVCPPDLPSPPLAPEGIGCLPALRAFADRWEPWLSASAGPRYLGFVTGGATPAAVVGDWLTSVYDQNAVSGADSAAARLELETVGWLRQLFGLPDAFHGAFVTGATMSTMVGIAVAREWLGEQQGVSVAQQGTAALGEVTVLSGSPHSSVAKALSMLGLGRDSLRTVALLPGREAVDVAALDDALSALGGRPAVVVANAGTVNTVDFDDLVAIAALRERHPFWLHVDGAFGCFAALHPDHAHLVDGLDQADSVCVDLHKWMNVPYDSAVQFTRRRDLQTQVFQNSAAYLGTPGAEPDFMHLTPENSRRLRALAAWFSLTAYGRAGCQDIVARNIASAHRVGAAVAAIPGVRLLAPVRLNVVCLAVPGDPVAVARSVADAGEAFVTPTVYRGDPGLRIAFSNWRTEESDEERVITALRKALS